MSATMARGLTDADYRERLLAPGRSGLQFSWERTAALALESLEALAAKKPRTEQRARIEHKLPALITERVAGLDPVFGELPPESLAECLAVNLPPRRARQFLIDVTELQQRDSKTGIQRVVRSLLIALMAEPPPGFIALPVYYDGTGRYRYAYRFLEAFAGWEPAPDELVDFCAADVYLGLDFGRPPRRCQKRCFEHYRGGAAVLCGVRCAISA